MESNSFDTLFTMPRPHILEMVCLSLDFESFKKCLKVSKPWSGVLTNKIFQRKVKTMFKKRILEEELTLRKMCGEGDTNGVRRILSSGLVNVDGDDGVKLGHDTPLILAATMGHHEIVRLLIHAGANVNWCGPTDYGKKYGLKRITPLIAAVNDNKIEVVKLLIDAGAFIDQADSIGWTPLQFTLFAGWVDGVNLLLDNGADINSANKHGETSLILAIMMRWVPDIAKVAKLLIERGADLEKADKHGVTPLTLAVRHNMPEMVKLLVDNGASLTHDAGDGTPLRLAHEKFKERGERHLEVFQLISNAWMTKIGSRSPMGEN